MNILITGARASTAYGEHVATDLAVGLTERGHTVLAPFGFGIGVSALRGALAAGGTPVAFVAAGRLSDGTLDPRGLLHLAQRVVEHNGELVLVSPDGSDMSPSAVEFERRSEVMAERADAVILVESTGTRSGSLRDVVEAEARGVPVFAVPGPITSATSSNPHRLILEGRARLLTSVEDLEAALGLTGDTPSPGVDGPEYPLTPGDVNQLGAGATPTPGAPAADQPHLTI